MTTRTIETDKGPISVLSFGADERLETFGQFFDALMGAEARTVAVEKASVGDGFFDLKSGLAGEVLQKVSNYRKRLVLLGDFSNLKSKSLRDFIYESNRTGQVVFADALDEAVRLLR